MTNFELKFMCTDQLQISLYHHLGSTLRNSHTKFGCPGSSIKDEFDFYSGVGDFHTKDALLLQLLILRPD